MISNGLHECIVKFVFIFVLFSVAGWVLEVIYRSLSRGCFVNPGALHGPWLPLYGTGALLLTACDYFIGDSGIMVKIPVYLFVTTGLELVAGIVSLVCFRNLLWNYSSQWLNYKGIICLKFSIYWVLLAFLFEYLVLPPCLRAMQHLPLPFMCIVGGMIAVCIFTEFIVALRRVS